MFGRAPLLVAALYMVVWMQGPTPVEGGMADMRFPEMLPPAECRFGCAAWADHLPHDPELRMMFRDPAGAAAAGNECMQAGESLPCTGCDAVRCPGYLGAWCKCKEAPDPTTPSR